MSTASNAAPALARQPFFDAPDNFAPDEGQRTGRPAGTLAGSCVLAAAVLDAVADLAGDSGSEAALLAKSGAAKTLESRHDALWNALRTDFLSPRGDARPAYAGALGHGLLATPCGLQAGADGALWATSLGGEGLAVLPPDGGQGRLVPLPGSRPWGLFQAGGGALWVCDFARPRLLLVEADGTVARELAVELADERNGLRPILGAADPDSGWRTLFCILADASGKNRRLARLNLDGGGPEFEPCPLTQPSALAIRGGRLYVSSQNPAVILSRPMRGGEWSRFSSGLAPEYLTQFTFTPDGVWLAARGRLARLDANGRLERVVDAAALSGYPGSNFCGLAALALPDGPRLFAADNIHNLVHAFRLD